MTVLLHILYLTKLLKLVQEKSILERQQRLKVLLAERYHEIQNFDLLEYSDQQPNIPVDLDPNRQEAAHTVHRVQSMDMNKLNDLKQ